ncbi:MAG: MBOAT family O-acyltransferase [Verrucomicrobiota bacterium]
MLFTSWAFILCYLPLTAGVFFVLPARWRTARKIWLALASLFFYGWWKVEFVPLLLTSIGVNYSLAEWISRRGGMPNGRWLVVTAVALNLGTLGFYKYTNFLLQSWGWLTCHETPGLHIVLPLAISFYTFTQIGYVVDVARDPRLHYRFLDYALFVLLFPHLIAGPIVRHWEIIPQYVERHLRVTRADLGAGLALFLLGLYKKTLLADPVAVYADAIYGQAAAGHPLTWFAAWVGTLAYALQIYFDFSGYSDMAIGLARMFTIRFPANFDSPYQAVNIAEFWRRWHMSLTRFLREYVYYPMGGNRRGFAIQMRNVLITFLLSGIWHGAGWTFVIWGAMHGCYLAVFVVWERIKQRVGWTLQARPWRLAGIALTFFAVMLTWVFFRSPTVEVAFRTVSTMLGAQGFTVPENVLQMAGDMPWLRHFFHGIIAPKVVDTWSLTLLHLCILLGAVWWLPNTQQLLSDYEMVLDGTRCPSRLKLRLGAAVGFVLGALLMLFVYTRYNAGVSPFIYFNF